MTEKIDISKVRHHGEQGSFFILLLISLVSLLVLILSVFGLIWLISFVLVELFFHHLAMAFFRANSIQATEDQYPGLYAMAKKYSEKLGLRKIPEIYIIQETILNAFATRVARRYMVVLYSHTVETMTEDHGDDALGMVLAHELGHIAAKHLRWQSLISTAALFMPPLYLYWSRCCEYTADRLAYLCLDNREGAVEGLLKLTVGKKMALQTNLEVLAQQQASLRKEFLVNLSEWMSTHPHLCNRIAGLKAFIYRQAEKMPTESGGIV